MKGGTRKRGSTWSDSFDQGTVGGKRQKRERGGYRTRKEAQAALAAAVAQYNRAGMPFSPKDITVADYLDQWLKEYVGVNLKFSTQISYTQVIQYHLKPRFGSYRLASLTTAAVQQYANDLKRDGYAKSTLVDIISVLSGALSYAVEPLQYIQTNPCEHVRIPKYEDKRQEMHHFLTADDMQRVLERFPEGTPFYVPIMIGYCCGLRISECFGLTWDRIDLDARTITIDRQLLHHPDAWYFDTPKTRTSVRTVRYGDTLAQVLNRAYAAKQKNRSNLGRHFMEYYMLPDMRLIGAFADIPVDNSVPADMVCVRSDGSLLTPDSFKYVCRVCRNELHIPLNYHSLRHTHATMLIEAGAPIKDVQRRLGHTNVQTTIDRYVHDTQAMQDQTVTLFENYGGKAVANSRNPVAENAENP